MTDPQHDGIRMKTRMTVLSLLVAAAAVGCSSGPDVNALQNEIDAYWAPCPMVKPSPVTIVDAEKGVVRYEYTLKVVTDGSAVTAAQCPPANSTMLQALANEDLANIKAGTDVPVTQEAAY
jgi:hypothetical protein